MGKTVFGSSGCIWSDNYYIPVVVCPVWFEDFHTVSAEADGL